MKTLLWLDDERDPTQYLVFTAPFAARGIDNVVWVKDVDSFMDWIEENGLPDGVSFDHDLGDQYERTGYDCAVWLSNYCLHARKELPVWSCHSTNPVGRRNIEGLLASPQIKKLQEMFGS